VVEEEREERDDTRLIFSSIARRLSLSLLRREKKDRCHPTIVKIPEEL
jgi:hypothetical protein